MNVVSFVTSILAILISAVSVWYTKRTYEKSLDPILKATVAIDRETKKCTLQLLNDGPINLYSIEVRKTDYLFATNRKRLSKTGKVRRLPPWGRLDLLEKGKGHLLPISADEVKDVFRNTAVWRDAEEQTKPSTGMVKFSITFRRKPDRKEFRVVSWLHVVKDSDSGEFVPVERDGLPQLLKDLEDQTDED